MNNTLYRTFKLFCRALVIIYSVTVIFPEITMAVTLIVDSAGCIYYDVEVAGQKKKMRYSTGVKSQGSNGIGPCPERGWKLR